MLFYKQLKKYFSLQLDESNDGKCFLITKDNLNVFDIAANKTFETLNFKKLLASFYNNNQVNSGSAKTAGIDFSDKKTSNPIKICSDVSKIDQNQVI